MLKKSMLRNVKMTKYKLVGIEHSSGTMTDEKTGKPVNWDYIKLHVLCPLEQPKYVTCNFFVGEKSAEIKIPANLENFNLVKKLQLGSFIEGVTSTDYSSTKPKTVTTSVREVK
jgi:hypothetical protein